MSIDSFAQSASASASTGMTSVKVKDYLEQDQEIRGQKFTCVSFISPEDILMTKEPFMLSKFLGFLSTDLSELFTNLKKQFHDQPNLIETIDLVSQRYSYLQSDTNMKDEFEFFKSENNDKLERAFLERNDFRTTVRGLKVRGSYDTLVEAQGRVQAIQKFDSRHNVYIAEVGCWCPWNPNPILIGEQEYNETALNSLVKQYNSSLEAKDVVYNDRKSELVEKLNVAKADPWLEKKEGTDTAAATTTPSVINDLGNGLSIVQLFKCN